MEGTKVSLTIEFATGSYDITWAEHCFNKHINEIKTEFFKKLREAKGTISLQYCWGIDETTKAKIEIVRG
jgi:hypothetical protein